MFKGNYKIVIQLIDDELGKIIAQRSSSSVEVIEQSILDVKIWKKDYEEKEVSECDQCHFKFYKTELSWTEDSKYVVCQDCLEKMVVEGTEQLNEK